MKRTLGLALATALSTVLLSATPASAEQLTITDPQGDSSGGALDILGVTVRNLDKVVAVSITFEQTTNRSNVTVSVDPRQATGVRMVTKFRPVGTSDTYLLRNAFTDRSSADKRLRCPGIELRQGMTDAGPTLTLRMPSKCLHGGDYGALRFGVLIERTGDGDWAPADERGNIGSTGWVARG